MKIITVTDAWEPQVNGVVRTIQATQRELERRGHQVVLITPQGFQTLPCPGYPDIRLALFPYREVARRLLRELSDDGEIAIHVATEGPLGYAAARFCGRHDLPFTSAYHTRFPQYLRAMFGIPERWTYAGMRHFHGRASVVLAATRAVEDELRAAGLTRIARWERAVDTELFRPTEPLPNDRPGPVFLYVGRVSVEKNIEAFLQLDLPGTKIVVGDGPLLKTLRRRYPEAIFTGFQTGPSLARLYGSADVFVFPSRTDTFGLVLLEALACGTPVAAFPVQGPLDVLGTSDVAVLSEDLRAAAMQALHIDRGRCRSFALRHSWRATTQCFIDMQRPFGGRRDALSPGDPQTLDDLGFLHRMPVEPLR